MTKKENKTSRHPVVVVLGHVDHGKTTLLDTIRKTSVAAGESGGITQHLSAYEISHNDKIITFFDTPGHETFGEMRKRGARVADVAILVVAADDGVKPQTKEALEAISAAKIPYTIALNKIDKGTSEVDRIKSELAEAGSLVEGWGGSVPIVPISAKEGTGVDELLDTVLLLAELEELTADKSKLAGGVVIESHLDKRRGPAAVVLVHDGTLKKGQFILADHAFAPVRIMETTLGEAISEAGPSTPVVIVGFNEVPPVGSRFFTYKTKKELEKNKKEETKRVLESSEAEVGIMLKADATGSLEALETEIKNVVPEGLGVHFFDGGVGDISEADIKNISSAKKGIVVGFRVKETSTVKETAERFDIDVKTFDVIYEAIDWLRDEFVHLRPRKVVREDAGKLLVLKVFSAIKSGRVIGGRCKSGKVPQDSKFDIVRLGEVVGKGSVSNVQRNKQEVEALKEGDEGGLLVQSSKAIEERDTLEFYYEREA
ncbi:MAG: translation initiation factor IF-2 [bacterium]|nr:translation initiation factor IF-2 [bacterium]